MDVSGHVAVSGLIRTSKRNGRLLYVVLPRPVVEVPSQPGHSEMDRSCVHGDGVVPAPAYRFSRILAARRTDDRYLVRRFTTVGASDCPDGGTCSTCCCCDAGV